MIYNVIYSLFVLIQKNGVFQQTVVRVYYILNENLLKRQALT